jgi:hypothetical protein
VLINFGPQAVASLWGRGGFISRRSPVQLEFHNGAVYGVLDWEILGAILVRFSGTGRAVLCAKRKEIKTAFDSRRIAPESPHGTMFREHFPDNSNSNLNSQAKRPVSFAHATDIHTPVIRNPYIEVRVSDFLSSTSLHETVRMRLVHETCPESSSEHVNPTKIDCRASPTHLEGSLGPSAKQNKRIFGPSMMLCFRIGAFLIDVRGGSEKASWVP